MANIVIPAAAMYPLGIGGIAMKAAGLVAADTAHTELAVGHSQFMIQMDWTACEIATGDELYNIAVEAEDASGTWTRIGVLNVLGASAMVGDEGDAPATGSVRGIFANPYYKSTSSKVRLKTWVKGTIATGINYSASLFPLENAKY